MRLLKNSIRFNKAAKVQIQLNNCAKIKFVTVNFLKLLEIRGEKHELELITNLSRNAW